MTHFFFNFLEKLRASIFSFEKCRIKIWRDRYLQFKFILRTIIYVKHAHGLRIEKINYSTLLVYAQITIINVKRCWLQPKNSRNWSLLASRGETKLRYNYAHIAHLCWINQR